MGYEEVLRLPIYTFWELAKNIDRIRADEDLRMVYILGNSIMTDPTKFVDELKRQRGNIVEADEFDGFDKAALTRLRLLIR